MSSRETWGPRAWFGRLKRRIKGEDLLQESAKRVVESEAENAEENIRRVEMLEENTKRKARLYQRHGHARDAAREGATAERLGEERARLEGRRDELLDLLGAAYPGAGSPRRGG